MSVNHYPACVANSIGCAVENIRDMLADPTWAYDKATRFDAMDSVQLLDYVMAEAADYREDGSVSCDCHARRLKAAEDALRLARKRQRHAFRAEDVARIAELKATRDALKAAS